MSTKQYSFKFRSVREREKLQCKTKREQDKNVRGRERENLGGAQAFLAQDYTRQQITEFMRWFWPNAVYSAVYIYIFILNSEALLTLWANGSFLIIGLQALYFVVFQIYAFSLDTPTLAAWRIEVNYIFHILKFILHSQVKYSRYIYVVNRSDFLNFTSGRVNSIYMELKRCRHRNNLTHLIR